jgi:hypothetical protein
MIIIAYLNTMDRIADFASHSVMASQVKAIS